MTSADIDTVMLVNPDSDVMAIPSVGTETTTITYTRELLTSAEIIPIYIKSRNRHSFAALLVERLFDVETKLRCNVSGRGKEKLDAEIIKYIQAKVFGYYE